ncbi:MAG TPA: hypothetical protein VFB96_01885 [Pirellulaceae bacterium]|nr:hypothetical protein [Pirellulaceae bacterium]
MRNLFGWTLVMVGCLSVSLLAQDARKTDKARPGAQLDRAAPGERAPAERAPGAAQGDQQIAALIYGCCRNHIEIATFAQDRLENPEAKQFAEKMVNDHTPGCDKMKELAGNLVSARAGDEIERAPAPGAAPAPRRPAGARPEGGARVEPPADTPAEERREAREERREERREAVREAAKGGLEVEVQPGERPGFAVRTGAGGALNWVAIHQQLADQCLSTVKKELGSKKGTEFDQCYMGHEVMTHLITIDQLTVLKNHASPTLRADLDKSIQMAQGHLREAKQIMEQLKGEGSEPRVSRTPGKAGAATPAVPKAKRE